MTSLQILFAILPILLTLFGMFISWRKWYNDQLRRDEVLKWADECIECLQTLALISKIKDPPLSSEMINNTRLKIIFDSSVLVERGRIFFKNDISTSYGVEKLPARRGIRPLILDQLIIAHQVARYWPHASDEEVNRRSIIAEDCLKDFVSLAQKEVGRDRAASRDALRGGDRINLDELMNGIDDARLQHWMRSHPDARAGRP